MWDKITKLLFRQILARMLPPYLLVDTGGSVLAQTTNWDLVTPSHPIIV